MDDSGTRSRPPGGQPGGTLGSVGETIGETVSGIIENLQNIVRGEVQLAKTEMKEEASAMGKGAGMAAAGALVGLVGFIFLMLGLTYLINKALEMWLSAGLVGIGLLIIGGILAMVGKNQISQASVVPEKTIASVKEDQEWASRQIKSVKR